MAVRDSEERLSKGGVYLLETGLHLFLWVGASVQQELLLNIFGTQSFSQIDPSLVRGNRSASMLCLTHCLQLTVILVCVHEGRPPRFNTSQNSYPIYHALSANVFCNLAFISHNINNNNNSQIDFTLSLFA